MKLFFLYQKVCQAVLVGLVGMSLNTKADFFSPKVELTGEKLSDALDKVLEKRIDQLELVMGKVLDNSHKSFMGSIEKYYPEIKSDIYDGANQIMHLGPVYAVGFCFISTSMNMYWQALNDYLNNTETQAEKLYAVRKKIFGKIKVGVVLSAIGIATLYNSHALARLSFGCIPKLDKPIIRA